MIFINFKNYGEGDNSRVLELVKTINECSKDSGVAIVAVVKELDGEECAKIGNAWVQYTDSPESMVEKGIEGTFLNHSDHKVDLSRITYLVSQCRKVGLKTMVFAVNINELQKVVGMEPDFVAYEPPELIASKETSVARSEPGIIQEAAVIAKAQDVPLIVGAGIKDSTDVGKSLELGAVGVAVSSAVVSAKNPREEILELAKGFK